jgi:hypothetical protein
MKVLLSFAAVLASATALAATVHADPNDAQFLKNIHDNMGREIIDSQALINSAHEICSELQQGKSADDVIKGVRLGDPDWNYYEAGYFVSASAEAYCPERVSSQ